MKTVATIEEAKQGQTIQFMATRIFKGNPVRGILQEQDEEWITVTLLNDIEGMVNVWYAGEQKTFRKSLIHFQGITV